MRPRSWLLCTRALVCVALGVSSALYVHYLNPADSDFCGLHSGCEAVRRSGFSYFFGSRYLSLPLFALLAYGVVLALTFRAPAASQKSLTGWRALWAMPELGVFACAGLGAAAALALIAYQAFGIGAFCWLCCLVDVTALLVALAAFGWARALARERTEPASAGAAGQALPLWSWLSIAGLVVAGPLFWSVVRPLPAVPPAITALYQPGKINVIEFADFECPYCRRLQAVLAPLISEYGDRVSFRRLQRPLAQHEFAEAAARAALCAEAQGKGEEMAARLFSMKLSEHAIENAAEALRLDPGRYGACVDSAETTATLASHAALLPDEQFQGLPTTYIGRQRILGVATETTLRDAFEQALRPERPSLSGPAYTGIWAALIGLVCVVGARRQSAPS